MKQTGLLLLWILGLRAAAMAECPDYTATASSRESAACDASFAIDGNHVTRWISTQADNQWLRIDLGTQRTVKGLQIIWCGRKHFLFVEGLDDARLCFPSAYQVELSIDGSAWTSVYSITNNSNEGTHWISVSPQSARYIRINCQTRYDSASSFAIYDVIVETDDECTPPDDYVLVWADEFDGTQIDPDNWWHQIGTGSDYGLGGWGNGELQYYTDSPNNSYVEDGFLVIQARKENFGGRQYTSARLISAGRRAFAFGKVQARMKIPTGQGLWPAFWMMPENYPYAGGWPAAGEIDIMESVNLASAVCGHLHFGSVDPYVRNSDGGWFYTEPVTAQQFANEFHVFTMEWTPDFVKWYVNDQLYLTSSASVWWTQFSDNPAAPFDKPFHIIMNIAIGGGFPGYEVSDEMFPHKWWIDWIRVYQKQY